MLDRFGTSTYPTPLTRNSPHYKHASGPVKWVQIVRKQALLGQAAALASTTVIIGLTCESFSQKAVELTSVDHDKYL